MRDLKVLVLALVILLSIQVGPAAANSQVSAQENWYTLVPGDEQNWDLLVAHMGLKWDDAVRYVLQWNPEVRNPYSLQVGQKLRIPGQSTQPAYPAFNRDFSKWVVVASHTSKFGGSYENRVKNIINGANWINNFFDDWRHPYLTPRDSMSLNWLLGEPTQEKGYFMGHAIQMQDGVPTDVPAWGGGICQIPSTIFPAALKAGLDVTARTNHSYYPYWWWSYPEGFGLDATIGSPSDPDLVIRNMYDYPVRFQLKADLTAMTLRVDVYGPPELKPYQAKIDGPYFLATGQPTAGTDGITWATSTVLYHSVDVGGSVWKRAWKSYYSTAPYTY